MKLLKNIGLTLCAFTLVFGLCGCGATTGTLIATEDLTNDFLTEIVTAVGDTKAYQQDAENDFTTELTLSMKSFSEERTESMEGSMIIKKSGKDDDDALKRFVQLNGSMNSKSANYSESSSVSFKVYLGKSGEKFKAIEQVSETYGEFDTMNEANSKIGELVGGAMLFMGLALDYEVFENLLDLDLETELEVFDLGDMKSLRVVINTTEYDTETATDATEKTVTSATMTLNTIGEGEDAKLMVTSFEYTVKVSEREATGEGESIVYTNWALVSENTMKLTISFDTPSITLPSTTNYKEFVE